MEGGGTSGSFKATQKHGKLDVGRRGCLARLGLAGLQEGDERWAAGPRERRWELGPGWGRVDRPWRLTGASPGAPGAIRLRLRGSNGECPAPLAAPKEGKGFISSSPSSSLLNPPPTPSTSLQVVSTPIQSQT